MASVCYCFQMRCVRDGTAGPGLVTVEAERWLQGVSWKDRVPQPKSVSSAFVYVWNCP